MMARKTPPSFDFYPDDFAAGVANMTATEVGAYVLLLCFQWGHGFVPSDRDELELITRLSGIEFDKMWRKVGQKFVPSTDWQLVNERMEVDRQAAVALHQARVEGGRKGGLSSAQAKLPICLKQKRSPRKGEDGSRKKEVKKKKCDPKTVAIPDSLQSPEFAAAWSDWLEHRQASRKPYVTEASVRAALAKLEDLGESRAISAIRHSLAGGYQGIYEGNGQSKSKAVGKVEF